MGLQTWKKAPKGKILESDVVVAKNYLDKEEITELNHIISMKEWKEKLELFFKLNEYNIIKDNGKIKKYV